jgi:Winged helix DNA-binding domain
VEGDVAGRGGVATVLDRRALNRALLARNLLLQRADLAVLDAVRHLVGLQAQEPQDPYVGLWSRLAPFDPWGASRLLEERALVRTLMMRRTVHLMTADDALALRALHQPMLEQRARAVLGPRLTGVDEAELATAGRPYFADRPSTLGEVARAVAATWPDASPRDLGDALSSLLPLVQVPPRGLWRQQGGAANTTLDAWLGRPLPPVTDDVLDQLVMRYLAAFGPAATADMRAWSGLAGLRAAYDRLRPGLVTFRDERGRTLFDLPDAPRPDPDVPAPPRFLPAFDNAVLGYDDRTRIIDDAHRGLSVTGARFLLVDGRVAGTWAVAEDDGVTVLTIRPLVDLTRDVEEEVGQEAVRLAALLALDPDRVRIQWM